MLKRRQKKLKKVEHHEDGTLVVDDLGGVNDDNENQASD